MLFNDYPFLLVFLPAAILIYRMADPHPSWRIPVLVLLSFAFYSYWNPPFIALLALSMLSTGWRRWPTQDEAVVDHHGCDRRQSRRARGVQIHQLHHRQYRSAHSSADAAFDITLPLGISFFTFHHIMYLVDLRGEKRRTIRSPLRALHRFLPAGACRPAGALVGSDVAVRPQGVPARLAPRVLPRHLLHRDGPVREDVSRRSGSGASSIRSMRRPPRDR